MKVLRHAHFPIEPQSALRSTQTQSWLVHITEQQAQDIEDDYMPAVRSNGKKYWYKLDKKGKIKTLSSPPNYVRSRRYLMKYLEYKESLREHGRSIGFIMPQDAFFMWFFMPMPKSWTKKKKAAMAFKLHKNKKDTDNLAKGLKDALAPRKNNFIDTNKLVMDDRVISSYANAKIYLPDEHKEMIGVLIVEYEVDEFLTGFFDDALDIMRIVKTGAISFY